MAWLKVQPCLLVLILYVGKFSAKRLRHPHEPVDSFKMIGSLPSLVAMYTSSDSPIFKCLSATRTRYDNEQKVATYVWHLKGLAGSEKKQSAFHIIPGNTVDDVLFTLDDDDKDWYTAHYHYSNYKNCLVATIPYNGEDLCMLWVSKEVVDDIPEDCIDQYEDTCDVKVPEYTSDTCIDDPDK
ncbi:uncharacterized protein LOC144134716 [Amblyomma americanum]